METSSSFPDAVRDYRFLLDRAYPTNASLKLVGDRYGLEKRERMILYRGVLSRSRSEIDSARVMASLPRGANVAIDGYNVLFTLLNYRRGHPLFIATDGLLRDAGGAYGRVADEAAFGEAITRVAERMAALGVSKAAVFLDAPVSGSAGHAALLREAFALAGVPADVSLEPSADLQVRDYNGDAAASSDSAIAGHARSRIFDLARDILESRYSTRFFDIRSLL